MKTIYRRGLQDLKGIEHFSLYIMQFKNSLEITYKDFKTEES
jgi:hypothetical protein